MMTVTKKTKEKPTPAIKQTKKETEKKVVLEEETLDKSKELTGEEKESVKDLSRLFEAHLKDSYDIEVETKPRSIIPTGIDLLDTILGGGVGSGLVMVVGMPGSGKSALAGNILAAGQKKWGKKFACSYMDSEDITTKRRLNQLGVEDLNPTPRIFVESVFQTIEGMCQFKEKEKIIDIPSVIVWDSIANTNPRKAEDEDDLNKLMGLKARILSYMLPRYVPKLVKYNITLLAINQLRSKIDISIFNKKPATLRYLPNDDIPGGRSILFNSIQLLYLRAIGDIGGEYGFHGSRVLCKAIKNKLFSPNIPINLVFNFERGFNNTYTNYELLKDAKRIVHHSKGWYKLTSCPDPKFQQVTLPRICRKSPELKKAFLDEVQDVLKTEYIDKYNADFDMDDPTEI